VTLTGSAGCSLSGSSLGAAHAGTCSVQATMAGNGDYNAVSSASTQVTFAKADQAALSITTTSGVFGKQLTLGVSGGTTGGSVGYQVTLAGSAGCSVSGGSLSAAHAGTCSVLATMAGNGDYNPVSSDATVVTFVKADQAALTVTTTSGVFGKQLALAVSGGTTGGTVGYQVTLTGSAGCSLSGSSLSAAHAGTCSVQATMAGNGDYNPVSSDATVVTFAKADQALLSITTTSWVYGTPLLLAVSGGTTGGAVTYQVTIGGSAGCSLSGSSLSATGAGTCSVRAMMAGNSDYNAVSSLATVITFGKPSSSLKVTITAGPPKSSNSSDAAFSFTSNDPGAAFFCSLDCAAFGACTSPASYSGIGDGNHVFEVRAVDGAAGNTESWSWTIDTSAPDTQIEKHPAVSTRLTTATFGLRASEKGMTFECRLDGSSWAACRPSTTYTHLAPGTHTFDARAKDKAGNTDPTPATFTWTIT
jgi:hypothetical protein